MYARIVSLFFWRENCLWDVPPGLKTRQIRDLAFDDTHFYLQMVIMVIRVFYSSLIWFSM